MKKYSNFLIKRKCIKCPDGWGVNGGSCYKYFDWAVDWSQAQTHCVSLSNVLDCSYLLKITEIIEKSVLPDKNRQYIS
jgi:hypothetical protein